MLLLAFACSEFDISREPKVEPPIPEPTTPSTSEPTTPTTTSTPSTTPTTPTEPPPAEAPVYANTSDELFEIDPRTGDRTSVGRFEDPDGNRVDNMVDIAIDLRGRMFGGNYDAIWRIDPSTAEVERVCTTDLAPYALAFTSEGVLFAGAASEIVEVDLDRNCATTALVEGSEYYTSGDLVGLPDGWLYWTVRGDGGGDDELVRVDPASGRTEWQGRVAAARLFGLGYDEGDLFGFSADGEIVAIDPADGDTRTLDSDGTAWWGATTNPVVW